MRNSSLAPSCLAVLFVATGCMANQAGGLVPAPLVQSSNRAAPASNAAHRLEPDVGSSIVEFKFASTGLNFITPDFAGNEWFGSADPLAMVSINEHTGAFSKYNFPPSFSAPFGIAINAAHNVLWFTEPDSNAIAYMNLLNDTFGQWTIPTHDSKPQGVVAGPDNGIWFTEAESGKIGRHDAITGATTEYKLPSPSKPLRITLGPDGALWFSNLHSIGRITTNGHIHIYSIGQNKPTGITAGPDGGVWFTGESDHNGSLLGRIDPATHVRKIYKYGSGNGGNEDITVRDSDFWMTRLHANRIDRFDHVTHFVHSHPLPQGYVRPFGIALGADDQLWFVNNGPMTTAIGKLCPGLPASQCKGAP
jgi:virginiamycin B lyase